MEPIKDIHFQPWNSKNYGRSRYGKLLLLGESHYLNGDTDSSGLTELVVTKAITERYGMRFSP